MSVLNHIITGTFTSDGNAKILNIPCDVDYMEVLNFTQMAAQNNVGVKYEWFRGMAADTGVRYFKSGGGNGLSGLTLASGGFTLVNQNTSPVYGPQVALTQINGGTPPVVSTGSTAGLVASLSVVRITNVVGAKQFSGMDFTIGTIVANTSFQLKFAPTIVTTGVTTGKYEILTTPAQFYPKNRFITLVNKTGGTFIAGGTIPAGQTEIQFSVTHGYTVGQRLVFNVPSQFGMTQLNGLRGQILAVDTTNNTVTVNIESSTFTAFAFPLTGAVPFTFAQAIPFGDAPSTLANVGPFSSVLDGATVNQAVRGMLLAGGADAPGGAASDVMYWKALKSEQYQTS